MITNQQAFQQTYVPSELHHREGAIETLTTTLRPLTTREAGTDIFIFGPSGTGKPTLARYVVELLHRENPALTSGYVDAMANASHTDALRALAKDTGVADALRREGTAASTYLDRLRAVDGQVLAVVDEVQVLEDYRTLQVLWEIPNVTLLLVCLDEDRLFAEFDSQLRSRLGSARSIRLDRYTSDEMESILESRVEAGLEPDIIDEDTLRYLADLAAGDARRGIALLRAGVEYAQTGMPLRLLRR